MKQHFVRVATVLACLGSASFAAAQPSTPPSSAKGAAEEHLKGGIKLLKDAKHSGDRALFERAYAELSLAFAANPDDERAHWYLVSAEIETKRFLDALRHLRAYDRRYKVLATARHPKQATFRQWYVIAYRPTGHLFVEAPAGARVSIDGQEQGIAPLGDELDVSPGHHVVEAARGGDRTRVEVEARAGEGIEIKLMFDERGPEPTVAKGSDGPVVQGVDATRSADAAPPPDSFWTTRRVLGASIAGAGLLALGGGGFFALESQRQADRAADIHARTGRSGCVVPSNPGCADLEAAYDAQNRNDTLAKIFLGAGAAAVLSGAVLFLWPSSRAVQRTALVPTLSPGGGGLQLRGELP